MVSKPELPAPPRIATNLRRLTGLPFKPRTAHYHSNRQLLCVTAIFGRPRSEAGQKRTSDVVSTMFA
jgi:hypothetical protein